MDENEGVLEFHLGVVGAWLPLAVMLAFITVTVITNKISLMLFSEGAFAAIVMAFLLAKDKSRMEQMILEGLKKDTLSVIIIAFLLAGILSQLLKQSGLIDGLIWSVMALHIGAGWLPLLTFAITALISAACGTTNGAIAAVTSILLPTATAMNNSSGIIMGAIISGAILAHNIAPVCDTSIISAMTQETTVPNVVRTRLPYAAIAGTITAILFAVIGNAQNAGQDASGGTVSGTPMSLIMLAVPLLMIILMLRDSGLIKTLLLCDLAGVMINLLFGFIKIKDMVSEEGPIVSGLSGMKDTVLFSILLFIVLNIIEKSGIFESLSKRITELCRSRRQAEAAIAGVSVMGMIAIGADVPAITALGPLIRKLGKSFGISSTRGANIMDGIQTALCGLLPYNPGFMIGFSLAMTSGCVGASFSFRDIVPYCYYSIIFIALIIFTIILGRQKKNERNG